MERNFDTIRDNFYPSYTNEFLIGELKRFCDQTLDSSELTPKGYGLSPVISHFFDELLYKSKSKNGRYAPNVFLENDELLKMAFDYIDSHPRFYTKKSDITNLKSYFRNSSKVGKVNNFNPLIARKIYEHYLPDGGTILDYSCGFGTRLSGAVLSPRKYTYYGIEPYRELYLRLLEYLKWLLKVAHIELEAEIFNCGSEERISKLEDAIDLSFSSPPYFDYERYTDSESQCYIKFKTYKEWLEDYVFPTLLNIYSYTKDGGLHLVNLQNVDRYDLISDWTDICREIGFKIVETRILRTSKRVSSKSDNKLIVFKKID